MTNIYKRGFDIFFSLLGIILLSPVYLVIYLAVRITEGCPVIYSQERIGLNGIIFKIYRMYAPCFFKPKNLIISMRMRGGVSGEILLNQLWHTCYGDAAAIGRIAH